MKIETLLLLRSSSPAQVTPVNTCDASVNLRANTDTQLPNTYPQKRANE